MQKEDKTVIAMKGQQSAVEGGKNEEEEKEEREEEENEEGLTEQETIKR